MGFMGSGDDSGMVQAALWYASKGWAVLPCRGKVPANVDGSSGATTDPATIRAWWDAWPNANVAIATGKASGLYVLDLDGPEAVAAIEGRDLPDSHVCMTGRGHGHMHVYMRRPDGDKWPNTAGKIAPRVDTRGDGGYVVAPPSVHPDTGRHYVWLDTVRASRDALADVPPWIAEAVRPRPREREPQPAPAKSTSTGARAYLDRAIAEEVAAVSSAPEGQRNDRLNVAAYNLGQLVAGGELSAAEVEGVLVDAAAAAGLEEREAEKTIASGMRAAASAPRRVPPPSSPSRRDKQGGHDDSGLCAPTDDDETGADWLDKLKRVKPGGKPLSTSSNVSIIFREDPSTAGVFGWDALHARCTYVARPPWHRRPAKSYPVQLDEDKDKVDACEWLEQTHGLTMSPQRVYEVMRSACKANAYDVIEDYLRSLEWDGVERVGTWLQTYAGVDDSPLDRAIGARWLVQAVARALEPGCKADYVLVLDGDQGVGKSTLCKILGGDWHSDNLSDMHSRDAKHQLQTQWVVELAELSAMKSSSMEAIKNFVTSRVDSYRPAYGRDQVDRGRRCVFVATTNETAWMRDPTGNRRFWPCTVRRVDFDGAERDRDQLWAEAVHLYEAGAPRWIHEPHLVEALMARTGERTVLDPWVTHLQEWADLRDEVTTDEILDKLGIEPGRRSRADQMRAADVGKVLGFDERRRTKRRGKRMYCLARSRLRLDDVEVDDDRDQWADPV